MNANTIQIRFTNFSDADQSAVLARLDTSCLHALLPADLWIELSRTLTPDQIAIVTSHAAGHYVQLGR
jgi:hypothetical protein